MAARDVINLPYYHFNVNPAIVDKLLERNGDFLLRRNLDEPVGVIIYRLAVRCDDDLSEFQIYYDESWQRYSIVYGDDDLVFPSMRALVEYFLTGVPIQPNLSKAILVKPKEFQPWEILGKGTEYEMTAGPRLGKGGFGVIHAIAFRKAGYAKFQPVAAKLVDQWDSKRSEDARSILYGEARVLLDVIGHPNIVSIKGVFVDTEYPAFAMDIVDGDNYFDVVRSEGFDKSCTRGKLLGAKDAASALSYLHEKGYVHRGLALRKFIVRKPVVAGESAERARLVLVGLRSARSVRGVDIYRSRSSGSSMLRYMAPETMIKRIWHKRSDIWSLGTIIWEIFSYVPPGTVTKKELIAMLKNGYRLEIRENVPDNVAALIKSCWNLAVFERPDADSVIRTLSEAISESVCTH